MYGTNTISDRAFRDDLNHHLNSEANKERQAELLEQEARDLTQPGEEFDPWTFEHFEEAIGNAPSGYRVAFFATAAAAADLGLDNDQSNRMALVAVRYLVTSYWFECAKQQLQERRR